MAVLPTIKVRAKIVLVVSHLDHGNLSKEESQSTITFNITDTLHDIEYAALITQLQSGVLTPSFD